jgi:hypothetical protein
VICATGFHRCGGACVNISASSCGASCTVCPVPANGTATCDGSLCGIVCNVGYKSCNGTCILGTGAC